MSGHEQAHEPHEQVAEDPGAVGLVDWHRVGRRVRASVLVLGSLAVVGWLVSGLLGDGIRLGALGGWIGLAVGALFLVEVVVVGGAAVGGMLRAGARGERLASDGVGLLPPRINRPADLLGERADDAE